MATQSITCDTCGQLFPEPPDRRVPWHMPPGWYQLPMESREKAPCPGAGFARSVGRGRP